MANLVSNSKNIQIEPVIFNTPPTSEGKEVQSPCTENPGLEGPKQKNTLSSMEFLPTGEIGFERFNDDQISQMTLNAVSSLIGKKISGEDSDRLGHVFSKRGKKGEGFYYSIVEERYRKIKGRDKIITERFEEICKAPNSDVSLHSLFQIASKHGWKLPSILRKNKKYALQCSMEYLQFNYGFKYNMVTHKLSWRKIGETSFCELTDRDFNTIFHKISRHEEIQITDVDLRRLLESDFVQSFDPLITYYDNLSEWDGVDRISDLAHTISCEPSHSGHWSNSLRKWLVGLVAGVYSEDEFNSTAIILQGKQNLGKSRWIRKLVPLELREFLYTGTIDPRDKDFKIAIFTHLLIDLDELDAISKYDISTLKSVMTMKYLKVRAPYGRYQEQYMRRSSFIGSVNKAEFLNDPTGSRRFLCFPVIEINSDHDIDIDMLYAQAKHYYKSGERYWFNQEESDEVTRLNKEFSVSTLEEDLIAEKYEACEVSDPLVIFFNTTEMTKMLFPENQDNSMRNRVGQSLTKLGFKKQNRKRKRVSVKLWAGRPITEAPLDTDAIPF